MDYSQYSGYSYPTVPGYTDPYAQPQQYQQQSPPLPPHIRNPFAPPTLSQYPSQSAAHDPEYEAQLAQWRSAYAPPEQQERFKKSGRDAAKGDRGNANLTPVGVRGAASATSASTINAAPISTGATPGVDASKPPSNTTPSTAQTVVRNGGGQTWEDSSLLEWDPTQFRIMVGNLAGEVTDDSLAKAFAAYGVAKARVIRDKRTTKSRGYGFVSFTDGEQGFKAAREMAGKYIGSHPVTIQRSKTDIRPVVKKEGHGRGKAKGGKGGPRGGGSEDVLRAQTGAGVEKRGAKVPVGIKMLG